MPGWLITPEILSLDNRITIVRGNALNPHIHID
jgi:hypothetical protein